jgi:hypothetical protein
MPLLLIPALVRRAAGAAHFAALCCCFALAACLGAFKVRAAACLGENTILLNFAVKLFEGKLEGVAGVDSDFTHRRYQLDLRSLDRPAF